MTGALSMTIFYTLLLNSGAAHKDPLPYKNDLVTRYHGSFRNFIKLSCFFKKKWFEKRAGKRKFA